MIPSNPGQQLKQLFLVERNLTIAQAAAIAKCTPRAMAAIFNGEQHLTVDNALAIEKATGLSAERIIQQQIDWQFYVARSLQS